MVSDSLTGDPANKKTMEHAFKILNGRDFLPEIKAQPNYQSSVKLKASSMRPQANVINNGAVTPAWPISQGPC